MKIIDEKGRIFGKINVIDFIIVLFLIFLIPMSYYGYKLSQQKTHNKYNNETKKITIEVRALASRVIPEKVALVSVGDKEYIESHVLGEITSIVSNKPSREVFLSQTEEKIKFLDHPFLKDIELIFTLKIKKENSQIFYQKVPIKIGNNFIFKTSKYNLKCQILEIINDKK